MKTTLIYIVVICCLFSCSKRYSKDLEALDLIPKSHKTIIRINSLSEYLQSLEDTKQFSTLDIDYLLSQTEFLNPSDPLYVSFLENDMAITTKYHEELIKTDSVLNSSTSKTKDKTILKTILNKDTIYHRVIDSLFFASTKFQLVKNVNTTPNLELRNFFATTSTESTASIFLKDKTENQLLLNSVSQDSIAQQNIVDVNFERGNILFSGITKSTDSTFKVNAFKNTIPQVFNLTNIIPESSESITRIGFDDYEIFSKNLSKITRIPKDSTANLLSLTNEIGLVQLESGNAIALNFLESEVIETQVDKNHTVENYRGIEIFSTVDNTFFKDRLQPFFEMKNTDYGFIHENFVMFSDKIETLKDIISNKLNGKTLSNSEKFKTATENVATASSFLIYKNEKGLTNFFENESKKFNVGLVQYIYDTNFAHVNGVFSNLKKGKVSNAIVEDFNFKIPAEILIAPQTVKNYINGGHDIILQDVNNVLYQISNSGKILWNKKLNAPILGKVQQIDIYKNGRLQLAFATQNRVYVIDRKGRDVSPFPLKFNDKITQPLSVFDYDNKRNYRLLMTQGKSLTMYDAKAKIVSGFKYKKSKNTIDSQPKHFRIGTKDYIVFSHGKKLEILNRKGEERIAVKKEISFSDSEIYNYQDKFTLKTSNGDILQINTSGKTSIKNSGLNNSSEIDATRKTLVSLTDNKLEIRSKTVNLDYGNYTAPKIFYLNDKIYITTTDLQTKKVYVWDSQAKLLPNFPVYGTSAARLEKLGRKNDVYLITQSDEKTVIVYKMN